MEITEVRRRLRRALGDLSEPFRLTFPGGKDIYELGRVRISQLQLDLVVDSTVTTLPPDSYTLDSAEGIVTLDEPLVANSTLMATGMAFGLFEDAELDEYIEVAVAIHTHERELDPERYREEGTGFIRYRHQKMTLANLPLVEEEPLIILATIQALWDMATDAASDVDVWTAEGTHLPRGQRYQQLMEHIDALQERYNTMAAQLGIGQNRIKVTTLRRVSKQTGRLVPIFREREYDEVGPNSYPKRLLPPIDAPNEDESGLPSPIWGPF
ncbi:hypothetical protein [Nonomuraea typhae]|uniref:Uncharacterized protein n=1 Tax=Nonomuraea typhae TaxID=2603600 RepID=A0ABW7YKP8_9ACTN